MSTTSPDTKSRGQTEASPRASKRARTDTETSDKGPNGRNRHRITRACNECRRRKDRCGGQRPSCKSCIENNRTCSYGPSKKRGLRPGYVRGIETLLGLIFNSIKGSEEWIYGLLEGVIQQSSFCTASGLHDANISVDLLLETWHKSSVSKKMGSLLSTESEFDEEGTDSSQIFDTKVVEGLTILVSTKNGTGAPMTPMDTNTTQPDPPLFDHSPSAIPASSPLQPCGGPTLHTSISSIPETVSQPPKSMPSAVPDLPKNWSYLLDLYFETTHCWFPISQKHELLRCAYTLSYSSSPATANSVTSGERAFLHAVLAYAAHQSTALSNSSRDKPVDASEVKPPKDLTQTSLFANPNNYDVGHVRALLIICLFEMDQKLWSAAWNTIARAVYTSVSIGLLPRSTSAINSPCPDSGKRTILGCATLETIIASRLNTVPYLLASDIARQGTLLTDGNEEWEPWQVKILIDANDERNHQSSNSHMPGHVISTFNQLLQTMAILNKLVCQPKGSGTQRSLQELMDPCRESLNTLGDLTAVVDLTPQAINLWITSITVLEIAAASAVDFPGIGLQRPEGHWQKITKLASLIEERHRSIGRCCISPVAWACMGLLQKSLDQRQLQNVESRTAGELDLARQAIANALAALQDPLRGEPQLDSQLLCTNGSERAQLTIQPAIGRAGAASNFKLPPTPSTLLSNRINPLVSQNPSSTNFTAPSPGGLSFPLDPSITANIEDDGLFDSLATLDTTDWQVDKE
ncbi:hypothetical protein FOPG_12657 [Fusarium oxysporum f. sp. conglutinans race 2 54008]|uniref:Zn(2)-C6 fungal-type domain-containing protein n=1 Tax=Fusarium oxysporum f. sp. conglutinans race 2 54008 TaxID=1089457 RepID=X0IEI0_FUSOX|nr:hypothetical protein FOPG_12657 [Fusarium oxysporum f. sp. conglutinans race 2 54008]KAG6993666.1 Quinic acid utilization activator [Fusarium oxysporum f. sp. conglutinans]